MSVFGCDSSGKETADFLYDYHNDAH